MSSTPQADPWEAYDDDEQKSLLSNRHRTSWLERICTTCAEFLLDASQMPLRGTQPDKQHGYPYK